MSPSPPLSRRGNGEVNILAMLDGQADKPLSRRVLALPAAVWYGLAGLLVCALLGALAWLVRDPGGGRSGARDAAAALPTPIRAAQRGAAMSPATADFASSASSASSAPSALAGADGAAPERAGTGGYGATIVNLPPAAADAARAPQAVDAATAPPPSMRQALEAPDAAPGRPGHRAGPEPVPLRHAGRKEGTGNTRAAARPDAPPRKRATPAKSGAASGALDTDVALISAIIQHVNKQGDTLDAGDAKDAKDAKSPTNRR